LSHRSGLTLLELVIALTILSVGLLGIALLQITAVRGTSYAGVSTLAARYAQDQVEIFRAVPFAQIDSSPGITEEGRPDYSAIPETPGISSVLSGNGIRVYRVWAVSRTTQTLKTISVWSCWRDETGKWHTVHLATQQGDLS
jgi:prepilin-type N-terminal cleavage/methylation domain-containing protein